MARSIPMVGVPTPPMSSPAGQILWDNSEIGDNPVDFLVAQVLPIGLSNLTTGTIIDFSLGFCTASIIDNTGGLPSSGAAAFCPSSSGSNGSSGIPLPINSLDVTLNDLPTFNDYAVIGLPEPNSFALIIIGIIGLRYNTKKRFKIRDGLPS